jgi:hypothetical protein
MDGVGIMTLHQKWERVLIQSGGTVILYSNCTATDTYSHVSDPEDPWMQQAYLRAAGAQQILIFFSMVVS